MEPMRLPIGDPATRPPALIQNNPPAYNVLPGKSQGGGCASSSLLPVPRRSGLLQPIMTKAAVDSKHIDERTAIPRDLFDRLQKAGDEAKARGAHRLECQTSSGGVTRRGVPKLVRRIGNRREGSSARSSSKERDSKGDLSSKEVYDLMKARLGGT